MSTLTNGNLILDYKVGLKRELVYALREVFGTNYPDANYRNKVQVHLEFPMEQTQFPAVFIHYNEGPIENVGVGHSELGYDDDGTPIRIRHFRFSGSVNFAVMARSTLERDTISAGLINALTIGRTMPEFDNFWSRVDSPLFVKLHLMTDQITPGGESFAAPPWNTEDERIYTDKYTVNVFGEFWNNPTSGGLVEIDRVNLFPYRPDMPVPQGTSDPAPWKSS